VSWLLYVAAGMAALSYFSLSIACSRASLRSSKGAWRIGGRGRVGAQAHHREGRGQAALAVFGAGVAFALAFAGVLQHGVLGGQALLGVEELGDFVLGVMEGFQGGDGIVFVHIGGRVAQRFGPIAGERGWRSFRCRSWWRR